MSDTTALPRLLRICEVAEALQISRSAVYRLTASGDLCSVRFGGSVRVAPEALRDFIKAHTDIGAEPEDGDVNT